MEELNKTYYTVKAENRQFEEAIAFINEVLRLHEKENPQNSGVNIKKVQIAGTNGKGSTAAMLSEILMQAGYKTGLYTSPSLVCVNERIRLNGEMISDADLVKYIPIIKQAQENIGRQFGGFERITAASMLYYIDNRVDIAIMETGLGGRFDTVSAVPSLILSSITSIGLDHMVMLGNTISKIAWEKCGIMRNGVPTISHVQPTDAEKVIADCAKELNCRIIKTDCVTVLSANNTECGQHLKVNAYGTDYEFDINLEGEYQRENAINALLCALELRNFGYNISDSAITAGFKATTWQGRLQRLHINGISSNIIIDGAHNPHAMKAVAEHITKKYKDKKFTCLMSVMADKDIDGVIKEVKRFADKIVCVSVTNRSCPPELLAEKATANGLYAKQANSVSEGLLLASKLSKGDDVYALGSLYLVGKVLEYASSK